MTTPHPDFVVRARWDAQGRQQGREGEDSAGEGVEAAGEGGSIPGTA